MSPVNARLFAKEVEPILGLIRGMERVNQREWREEHTEDQYDEVSVEVSSLRTKHRNMKRGTEAYKVEERRLEGLIWLEQCTKRRVERAIQAKASAKLGLYKMRKR